MLFKFSSLKLVTELVFDPDDLYLCLQVKSCWRRDVPPTRLQIGHNTFSQNKRLGVRIKPAVNMIGVIEFNRVTGKYLYKQSQNVVCTLLRQVFFVHHHTSDDLSSLNMPYLNFCLCLLVKLADVFLWAFHRKTSAQI